MVFSVHANTVTITLFWSYSGNYNVQEGSVIQLVMFRTGSGHNPGSGVNNNFDAIGTYDGATVYDPYSVPNNHYIVYETAVEAKPNGYYAFIDITVVENYNRIYLRIFSEPIDSDMDITYSYWGLTALANRPAGKQPVTLVYSNFTGVTNHHQFGYNEPYFEVIPEPSTIRLIILGVLMFLGWKKCKYCYEH